MKIEIDTERDSERELRAVLHLLQSLLGYGRSRDRMPAAFGQDPSGGAGEPKPVGMFSIFDAPPSTESNEPEQEDDSDLKHYDEEVPRIEPY